MKITRKQLFIMYAIMLLLILFSNIFGYSDKNYKPKYGVTTANVNLRKTANLNSSSIIQVVKKNSKVKIVGEISSFYITQLTNNQVGLLSKSYVKISGNSLKDAKVYENLGKYYAYIKGSNTNVRGGPSTSFKVYAKLQKNDKIQVIGKIDNFNMIVTSNNTVGMIRSDLISKTSISNNTTNNSTSSNNNNSNTTTTPTNANINTILTLINNARKSNGLTPYTLDKALTNVAQIKADDMVQNNYFSHTSSKYGSPFEMMQGFGISYKSAGENIAGNPSLTDAVNAWLASSTHKANILSKKYNYVGIGLTKSNVYGYIIVAMFIQK